MNTIKIYLTSGGRIADLHKDFPLFQGQYQNKLLNVFVPTTILSPNFAIQHFIGTLTSETTPQNGVLDGFVVSQLGREKAKGDTIYAVVGTTTTDYFVYVFDGNEWTREQVNYFNPTRVAGTNVDIGCISTQRNGSVAKSKTYAMRFVKTLTYQNEEYALYERKLPQEFTYYSGQGTNAPTIVVNVVNVDLNEDEVISIITSQTCSLDVMPSTVLDNDEVIEPSEYEQINATLNTLTEELAEKQNKAIPNSSTNAKTVEGAINELDTRSKQNTATSSSNTMDIMELQEDVAEIKGMLITGEEFIGTLTVQDNLPTDQVLDNFVLQTKGRAVAGGDVVIVIVQRANETNRNYKYIYNGSAWSYYEIPLIETAKNGILGIVKGTYGVANYNTLVNIVDGEIRNIYIKKNNEYVDMSNVLATTSITLDDIMTGATAVSKANQDGNGNNIADTYLTKNLGASKQFVKDYALPVEFNDVHYLNILSGATSYQKTISANSDRKQVATALGETEIFSATYSLTDTQFQLSNNNRFINKFYITLSASETVYFRLITSVKKQGQALTQASAILTDSISITANTITAIHIDGNMSDISKVVEMTDGDQITQTFEVVRDTGSTNTATIVSNTTYPSTFYLTTVGKTISVENALKGEITAINTQSIVIDNGVAYAPFGLTEDLVENAEYQFNIPIDDTLDTSLRLFLRADNINHEIITPYGTTTAYISDLNQTKTANGTYRFTAIFQNNAFVIEQSNLNGILTPSALANVIKGSDTISVDENAQGTELIISLDADAELSTESTNAVQNKVVTKAVETKMPYFTEWNAETTYKKGDIVYLKETRAWAPKNTYLNFVAKQDNVGQRPTHLDDDAYWDGYAAPLPVSPKVAGGYLVRVFGFASGSKGEWIPSQRETTGMSTTATSIRAIVSTDGNGGINIVNDPTNPTHLTNRQYVDELVATKTLYLHEYTLVGTIAGVSNSSMYVKVLTKQDTAFTSAGDVFGLPPYANVIDVRFSVNNTIVVFERILLGELEIRYINQNGLFYSGIDIYNELSISGTPTITQLN